jgi:RecB family endonuclease NucS
MAHPYAHKRAEAVGKARAKAIAKQVGGAVVVKDQSRYTPVQYPPSPSTTAMTRAKDTLAARLKADAEAKLKAQGGQ